MKRESLIVANNVHLACLRPRELKVELISIIASYYTVHRATLRRLHLTALRGTAPPPDTCRALHRRVVDSVHRYSPY